jgi:hypothetical protein
MRLTRVQVKDLYNRMDENDVEEVEVNEATDGRLQFYIIETKIVKRPLRNKRSKNGNGEEQ